MTAAIHIRPATPADIAILARFNRAMALETENKTLDPDTVRQGVANLLNQTTAGFYLIAEIEGVVVGGLLITYEWSDWRNGNFWWLQSVYVEPAHRQRGVFRALYQHVHHLAHQRDDVCGLRLYVERENQRAQETYRRLGMQATPYDIYEEDWSQ